MLPPSLDTTLHIDMLRKAYDAGQPAVDGLYGLHWGDPEKAPILARLRERFIAPYVGPAAVACEIGPGGGRWTRYLVDCKTLYAVDYHQELLDELAKNFVAPNIIPIKNNGSDFPGISASSVDFLFSFGVFVHLERDIIAGYLASIKAVLARDGTAIIQYSDKTKQAARRNATFSHNTPDLMRAMVRNAGFDVVEEDTASLFHSAVIRFRHRRP